MGFKRSLRFQLAAWYSVALAAGLLLIGLLLFAMARYNMLRHYDGPLKSRGEKVLRILNGQESGHDLSPKQMEAINQVGRLVLVEGSGANRQVIYHWPEISTADLELQLNRMNLEPPSPPTFETLYRRGVRWRIFSLPYLLKNGRKGAILIIEDLGDVQATIRQLLIDYVSLAALGLIVSFYGSYWLSGRALRPIFRIIDAAKEIEASNLDQRLPEPGLDCEVGSLVDTLNRMFGRLEASFESMKRFTADASHELRSPLATVRNTIDVTLEQPRTPEQYQAAMRSNGEEVDRIRTIVEDLLLFARADAGKLALRIGPIQLDSIVEAQVEAHQFQAEGRNLNLQIHHLVPEEITGDERWLHQVVGNLLDNAIKFTPVGGAISVDMQHLVQESAVRITVSDTGPGIPEADLQRVFERFFRADPSRSRANVPGLGLGLAIAAWVVKEHGGSLRASNRPEGGTTFTLDLPIGWAGSNSYPRSQV